MTYKFFNEGKHGIYSPDFRKSLLKRWQWKIRKGLIRIFWFITPLLAVTSLTPFVATATM